MAEKSARGRGESEKIREPSILIRPINRMGGLDNIHVALLALVAILVILLLLVSYYRPALPTNSTQTTTVYSNSTYSPVHTPAQIKTISEQLLASYAQTNSSLSVLPYYANVSAMSVSYIPSSSDWYVQIPSVSPSGNSTFYISAIISDKNGSVVTPFIQLAKPPVISKNTVVAPGVINLAGKPSCISSNPLNIYWFIDAYAPGSVQSLRNITSLESNYGSKVNVSVKILYGSSTAQIADQVGTLNAQELGKYILCSSTQPNFPRFVSVLNSIYNNDYISQNTLQSISSTSGLNQTALNTCISNANGPINAQMLLAQYYNITSNPSIIVNCEYQAIPQTVNKAICYAKGSIC
jgi:hypothetical protein